MPEQPATTTDIPVSVVDRANAHGWGPVRRVHRMESRFNNLTDVVVGLAAIAGGVAAIAVLNALDLKLRSSVRVPAILAILWGTYWVIRNLVGIVVRRYQAVYVYPQGVIHQKGNRLTSTAWDDVTELQMFKLDSLGSESPPAVCELKAGNEAPMRLANVVKEFADLARTCEDETRSRQRPVSVQWV